MSIGATYKDPRSGLHIKHIVGEIIFRRVGKGIVEAKIIHTYKVIGELAFSYKQPIFKWIKASEANTIIERIFKDAELALEPLTDLHDLRVPSEGFEIPLETPGTPPLDVPYNPEVRPEEVLSLQDRFPDSK
jgi:hypothetical protein